MIKKPEKKLPDWIIEKLPRFESAEHIPQRFDDSTHELWRLKLNSADSSVFLKICNNTDSPFWQIMQHLFGLNLRAEIGNFDQLYALIDKATAIEIPQILKAETLAGNKSYILTNQVKGAGLDEADVTLKMVEQFAEHIAALHHMTYCNWGPINKSNCNFQEWPVSLSDTLSKFASGLEFDIPDDLFKQALNSCKDINAESFIPMMPDLRWDQFYQQAGDLFALLDLDAFVLAPRELEFVLLEYILTAEQCSHFVKIYSRHHTLPELTKVRPAYRLLLFFMEVLGEQNIHNWMNKEHLF